MPQRDITYVCFCFCKDVDPHYPRNRARPRAVGENETCLLKTSTSARVFSSFSTAKTNTLMRVRVKWAHYTYWQSDIYYSFTSFFVTFFDRVCFWEPRVQWQIETRKRWQRGDETTGRSNEVTRGKGEIKKIGGRDDGMKQRSDDKETTKQRNESNILSTIWLHRICVLKSIGLAQV